MNSFRLCRALCGNLVLISITVFACSGPDSPPEERRSAAEQPDTLHNRYAEGFQLIRYDEYTVLEILNPFQNHTDTLRYALVREETDAPQSFDRHEVVKIPVKEMLAASTTHIGLLEALGATDVVTGMIDGEYLYNEELREGVVQGDVANLSSGELNREAVIELDPQIMMISGGVAAELDEYQVLEDSGIRVIANTEWLEKTPLGKAEWIRVMGALLDRQEEADSVFSSVADSYEELRQKVSRIDERPKVINNLPYRGSWYVSGGNSVTAQYFRDAGADYPWSDDDTTGGLQMEFEAVYEKGLRADLWLHPGDAMSIEEILETDRRFRDFRPVHEGEIYNNNARKSEAGGNDFWESGVVRADRVLADLIHILHPEIHPDHELYYYHKLD